MVVASRHVWDAYIKVHPEAQFYRNKALMNFNDLCLIYAHTTGDRRYSLSSHDIDFDDDIQGVNTAEEKEGRTSSDSECLGTNWTSTMDRYLIELLQDQVLRGNKIGHGFVSEAWIEMVRLFNAKFGSHHDKDGLRNRYKHLRGQYNDIKALLD